MINRLLSWNVIIFVSFLILLIFIRIKKKEKFNLGIFIILIFEISLMMNYLIKFIFQTK